MNRIPIIQQIDLGLKATLMDQGGLQGGTANPSAVTLMTHLGYPVYFSPYIGVLKRLAVTTVLLPVNARLKEWAFAGLFFVVTGALYSAMAFGGG